MNGPLDTRPRATYRGDARGSVGQPVGPTLHGEVLVIDDVTFDPDTGRSTARFRYATRNDLDAWAGGRRGA